MVTLMVTFKAFSLPGPNGPFSLLDLLQCGDFALQLGPLLNETLNLAPLPPDRHVARRSRSHNALLHGLPLHWLQLLTQTTNLGASTLLPEGGTSFAFIERTFRRLVCILRSVVEVDYPACIDGLVMQMNRKGPLTDLGGPR